MLARCSGSALRGLEAVEVNVEVDIAPGLPGLQLVGLPDTAVQEARERVRAALRNSGLKVPLTRVVVSLAPADLRKAGPGFDLPIALGLLVASGQLLPQRLEGIWSAAELGLDGRLRPIRGVLAMAMAARQAGARGLVVPAANASEAALVEGLRVWGPTDLAAVLQLLHDPERLPPALPPAPATAGDRGPDLADVRGAGHGRRALEIAAAGGHHLLLVGSAGSGKTMLAQRLPGLLPPLERSEALEVMRLHSVAGLLEEDAGLISRRPFRSPHHSCSGAALIGGGSLPMPGELSLAHHGVLFLDELAEFRRDTLDLLRQPLEEGEVRISRARMRCRFPCRVTLVAATNPCPCGRYGTGEGTCSCGEGLRRRYWGRLSGPLLDRLDLQVVMHRPDPAALAAAFQSDATCYRDGAAAADPHTWRRAAIPTPLTGTTARSRSADHDTAADPAAARTVTNEAANESSAVVAMRVQRARAAMAERNPGRRGNGELSGSELAAVMQLEGSARQLWQRAVEQRQLSARAALRVLRVARTIADLAEQPHTPSEAIAEALTFRSFDLTTAPGGA
ncbi:MAG: YifB family Mg chelatase-like AAA ATPase [Cyanobium sp.]